MGVHCYIGLRITQTSKSGLMYVCEEWLERLNANVKVATVLGSSPATSNYGI